MNEGNFAYTLREFTAQAPLEEYIRDCVDIPRFLSCCQACPHYGAIWSCPPYDFDPMELWQSYAGLRIYGRMLVADEPGQDVAAAMAALKQEKDAYLDTLMAWEEENPGSLALAAGSCNLCLPCSRQQGQPCQKPAQRRYSLESLGGHVALTASRYLGYPLLWIKDGNLPDYLMLIGALLLPAGKGNQPFA